MLTVCPSAVMPSVISTHFHRSCNCASACADCDTCRWIAPEFFGRENEQSAMIQQPESEADRVLSFQALVSCPT